MTENLADELSQATERHCTLYSTWADGGSGLLLTGNFQIDRRYLERPVAIPLSNRESAREH